MANPFFVDPNADTCSNTMNIGLRMGQLAQTVQKISKLRVKRMVRILFKCGLISRCFSFCSITLYSPQTVPNHYPEIRDCDFMRMKNFLRFRTGICGKYFLSFPQKNLCTEGFGRSDIWLQILKNLCTKTY